MQFSFGISRAERVLRGPVGGRNNRLFFGSDRGGRTRGRPHEFGGHLQGPRNRSLPLPAGCLRKHQRSPGFQDPGVTPRPLARFPTGRRRENRVAVAE
jgi:hypothetical protein